MYILLETCQHPAVLRILYFALLLLDIVTIIIPIGLIVMLLVDFAKAVISSNEEGQIKSTKLVVKRIIYAIIVFAIPWIVSIFVSILDNVGLETGNDYNLCITNAKGGNFEYYDSLLEAEEKAREESRKQKWEENNNNSSSGNVASGRTYKEAAKAMIELAKRETGNTDGTKYSGKNYDEAWCGHFTMWNLKNTTVEGEGTVLDIVTKEGRIGSCGGACAGDLTYNFFNNSNLKFHYSKFYGGNYTPKTGDLIFFWSPSNNGGEYWDKTVSAADYSDHIGLVTDSSNGKVYTVEGNYSNKVSQNTFDLNNDTIMGYGSWYN